MSSGPALLPGMTEQERAWATGEWSAAQLMGTINASTAALCEVLAELIANDGWAGHGIASPEHWATWKAGISKHRARSLVTVARRVGELPECFGLFRAGRITEDVMVRIARKVPAERDHEFAGLVPIRLVSQLDRLLAHLPHLEPTACGDPGDPPASLPHLGEDRRLGPRRVLPAAGRVGDREDGAHRGAGAGVPEPPRPR